MNNEISFITLSDRDFILFSKMQNKEEVMKIKLSCLWTILRLNPKHFDS